MSEVKKHRPPHTLRGKCQSNELVGQASAEWYDLFKLSYTKLLEERITQKDDLSSLNLDLDVDNAADMADAAIVELAWRGRYKCEITYREDEDGNNYTPISIEFFDDDVRMVKDKPEYF